MQTELHISNKGTWKKPRIIFIADRTIFDVLWGLDLFIYLAAVYRYKFIDCIPILFLLQIIKEKGQWIMKNVVYPTLHALSFSDMLSVKKNEWK